MTTETPSKSETKTAEPATAVTIDNFEWITTEHGQFRIAETRYMYKSVDQEGNDLIFGLTEEAIRDMTPMHLASKAPDYDGRFNLGNTYSASTGVKL